MVAVLTAASPAAAQEGMRMRSLGEGLEIGASLSAAQVSSDNFFYQPSNDTEVEGLLISPALSVKQTGRRSIATLDIGAQFAEFDLSGDDSDYVDSQIVGRFNWDGGVRNSFGLFASNSRGHDPFGVDRTAGQNPNVERDLDEWILNRIGGNLRFGAPTATLNLELDAEYLTKDYTTNEDITQFLDLDKILLTQTLAFNYSPKTAFILEIGEDFATFDNTAPDVAERDAREVRVRGGVRWKATAKTTGDLRFGAARRSLDNTDEDVIDGASWMAKVTWEPVKRSSFTLESARSSQETVNPDVSVIDNRRTSLAYTQGWGKNFRTVLAASTGESEFIGTTRVDDIERITFSAIYSFRGSLAVYADVYHLERDSNFDNLDFDSLASIIGVRLSP